MTFIGCGSGGEDPQPTEKWTATPANNSTVDVLKSVQVTINEGLIDQVDGNEANITFVHPEGKHADIDAYCQYVSKNTFNIVWSQGDIYKQGEYKFTVSNLKDVTITQKVGENGDYYTDVQEHAVLDPIEITVNVDGTKEADYANIDAVASVNTIGLDYIDIKLDGYEDNLSIVDKAKGKIYKEDGTLFAENIVLSASFMGKYVRLNRNPFPNETAKYYAIIPENSVMYKSRYFNEIRCDISVVKEEEPTYSFTPLTDATNLYELKEVVVKIDGITEHEAGKYGPDVILAICGSDYSNATSMTKNDDGTYTIGFKGYEGPATVKITFDQGTWKLNGKDSQTFSISYKLIAKPKPTATVVTEGYQDGAAKVVLGTDEKWVMNITDGDAVAEVRYWFTASWVTDWVADNNGIAAEEGAQAYRVAEKVADGYQAQFWTNYREFIPLNESVFFNVALVDGEGNILATQKITWTNDGTLYNPTLTYDMLTFDPAAGSELESATTLINVKAEQDLSKIVAYTAPIYDKTQLDEQNLPKLLCDRIDYGVAKVNEKEWCIILKLSDEYLAATNGEVYLAIEAYDKEGYPAIDALYTMLDYKYAAAAKVAEVSVTPINGTVAENLDVFTFANVDANTTGSLGRNYSNTEKASLAGGDYIYTFADSDWNSEAMTLTVPTDKQPTEAGVYTLNIPQGYFLVGDDNPAQSKPIVANYGKQLIVEVHDTTYIDVPAAVVAVTYNVSSKIGEAETVISNTNTAVEKGKAFTADINVLDENWTAEVTGATLAENVITTAELTEDATVSVVYTYNGTIVVIDDEATGIDGAAVEDLKVASVNGKIVITGLNEGDTAMLYSMNAALLATGKAAYDKIEFEAPAGITYLVSIIHNGKKIGVKVMNK